MVVTEIASGSCPNCQKTFSRAATHGGHGTPVAGDVTVCMHCGMILKFTEGLGVRRMATYEMDHFRASDKWDEMVKFQIALDKMLSVKSGTVKKEKKYFS